MASELGLRQTQKSGSSESATERQVAGLEKQLKTTQLLLKKAQKSKNETEISRAQRRVDQLQSRIEELTATSADGAEGQAELAQKTDAAKLPEIVRGTYLRTLSREPRPDELEKSVAYISSSTDQLAGVRDVLWALVNTKEFIVNH